MAFGLLAAACGSDADNASTVPPAASQPEQPDSTTADATWHCAAFIRRRRPRGDLADGDETTATAAEVPEALQFTAPLVGGGEFTGADYAGKPTVFWFWAPT